MLGDLLLVLSLVVAASSVAFSVHTWRETRRMRSPASEALDEWAVVELMGHVCFGARVRSGRVGGADCIICEIPGLPDDGGRVQRIRGGSLYRLTRCSQEVATRVAAEAVERWGKNWSGDKVLPWACRDRNGGHTLPLPFEEDGRDPGEDCCTECEQPVELCQCDDDGAADEDGPPF